MTGRDNSFQFPAVMKGPPAQATWPMGSCREKGRRLGALECWVEGTAREQPGIGNGVGEGL